MSELPNLNKLMKSLRDTRTLTGKHPEQAVRAAIALAYVERCEAKGKLDLVIISKIMSGRWQ